MPTEWPEWPIPDPLKAEFWVPTMFLKVVKDLGNVVAVMQRWDSSQGRRQWRQLTDFEPNAEHQKP